MPELEETLRMDNPGQFSGCKNTQEDLPHSGGVVFPFFLPVSSLSQGNVVSRAGTGSSSGFGVAQLHKLLIPGPLWALPLVSCTTRVSGDHAGGRDMSGCGAEPRQCPFLAAEDQGCVA